MWCEAYVQTLRLALLPAELSISKMSKSQNLKMHRTQNSQRKVDCKRREEVVNDFDQRSLARTSFNIRIPTNGEGLAENAISEDMKWRK